MSPNALSSGAPTGGLANSSIAVSSMPLSAKLHAVAKLLSALVRLALRHKPMPVTYMALLELKGSMENEPIQCPMFPVCLGSQGALL